MTFAPGWHARVTQFAATREDGVAHGVELARQEAPDSLGPDEVLVQVESASVAYIDLLMLSGQYHHKPPLPYTPGLEYAGVVLRTGSGVRGLQPGDRVLSDFLNTGPRSAGAYQQWGGWARYALAPAIALHRIPASLSFDAACNLLLNYETAQFAFASRLHLQPGETVLVTGATGAAGLAAVQVAKLLGAGQVIATGRGLARLGHARSNGADQVIDLLALPPEPTSLRDAVKALTGGEGVDLVFDTVGGDWLVPALRTLCFGGRMAIIGWAANTNVAAGHGAGGSLQPDLLPTNLLQLKGLTVTGSPTVITGQRDPQGRAQRLGQLLEWMQAGALTPVVTQGFGLQSLRTAMQARLAGVVGGCVVRPGDEA